MKSWKDAPLVALDLEGSGAQDRDDEAILEIAVIPILGGSPSLPDAYSTLINPGRTIPKRPWISSDLTNDVLAGAPHLAEVSPELTARLNGKVIVGHNVGVDWRLLHRRCPGIQPQALIDTLRLARHVHPGSKGNGLNVLLDRHHLTAALTALLSASGPHRALWDAIGSAALLAKLIEDLPGKETMSLTELLQIAGQIAEDARNAPSPQTQQPSLLDT